MVVTAAETAPYFTLFALHPFIIIFIDIIIISIDIIIISIRVHSFLVLP